MAMQDEQLKRLGDAVASPSTPRLPPRVPVMLGIGCAPTPCVAVHVENTQVPRFAARLRRLRSGAASDLNVQVMAELSPIIYARASGDCADLSAHEANEALFAAVDAEMGDGRRDGDAIRRIAAHRVYRLDWSCAEAHWVPFADALRSRKQSDVIRVVAFPRALQLRLKEMLSAEGFRVHPTHFSAELHAVTQPALSPYVHFGVVSRSFHDEDDGGESSDSGLGSDRNEKVALPLTAGQAPSRAYFKLQESLRDHLDGCVSGAHALDIGASPGGWTDCLVANRAGLVVAVDPGELTIPTANRPIVHVQSLLEDALDDIRAVQRREEPARLFDLCVCDINTRVELMAQLVASAAELLAPGGRLVCTLKLGKKPTEAAVQRALAAVIRTLEPKFCGFRLEWLHANTQNERTLFAERRRDDERT